MKKQYLNPEISVVKVDGTNMIATSTVSRVSSNTNLQYGGGNNGSARVKDATEVYDVWDDDWSAE